jgi:hypothetical protein
VDVQDFTIPKGQAEARSVSTVPQPTPAPPASKPAEDAGVLQWILYGLRTFLMWLVHLIDACLAA